MPAFRDELTKKEGAHTRLSLLARTNSNALLKKAESDGGERWGRTRARRGRVCARLCVDRGVNKRYTNVSHLGVYPSSFRWPVLFFVPLPFRATGDLAPSTRFLRRSDGEQEREAIARRAVHVGRGVTARERRRRHEFRSGSHSRRRATTPSVKGWRGIENEGDEGGARLVRAHGGEKSRAPHPPWHVRGEAKEVW